MRGRREWLRQRWEWSRQRPETAAVAGWGVELGSAAGMPSAEVGLRHMLLTYSYGIKYRKNREMSRDYEQTSTIPIDRDPASLRTTLSGSETGISRTGLLLQRDASQTHDEV